MARVYATVTVDWEGYILDDNDINAMRNFQATFPNFPLTHFICPAYFTRGGTAFDFAEKSEKIRNTIKPADEVALHIHCWYSLMQACGIQNPLTTLTYYPANRTGPCAPYVPPRATQDCGHGVPLGLYTRDQIRQILSTSLFLLSLAKIIGRPRDYVTFRTGGWMACDRIFDAESNAEDQQGCLYQFWFSSRALLCSGSPPTELHQNRVDYRDYSAVSACPHFYQGSGCRRADRRTAPPASSPYASCTDTCTRSSSARSADCR